MNTHVPSNHSERLGEFILLRLYAAGNTPPTKSTFDKQFRPYFAEPVAMSSPEWHELLDGSLLALQSAGRITDSTFQLTDKGRSHALDFLSVKSIPANIRWQSIRNRYLIAKSLNITPRSKAEWDRLGKAEGVRAATLTRHYELPISPVPTVAQTLNALAWLQLKEGHEQAPPFNTSFTRDGVLRETLLGGRTGRKIIDSLAARVSGAASTHPDKVRHALICSWLHRKRPISTVLDYFDLPAFAQEMCQLARTTKTGRFGDHKVFISHVWKRFCNQHAGPGMTRDEFNCHLVEANRKGLLTLTRADLISAMEPDDVHQSEIRLHNSSFHFICTDALAV